MGWETDKNANQSTTNSQTAPTLKHELGLRDLTLFAITCIISARYIPRATHSGTASITLWLLAALFFVVPLTIAVAKLVVKYPGTGGLYLGRDGILDHGTAFCAFGPTGSGSLFCFRTPLFCT